MSQPVQAAVLVRPNAPLQVRTLSPRPPSAGELLVRVGMTTLCGSDLHTYTGRRSAPIPSILGHEIVGEVVETGPGDPPCDLAGREISIGQRITWSLCVSCGNCFFCQRDLPQKCAQLFKYGHEALSERQPLSGGLAQLVHLLPGTATLILPDGLTERVACPANCATATVAAALRTGGLVAGEAVLVQGCGMLGLTACAMCAQRGAQQIIATDVDPQRLQRALAFGATSCWRSTRRVDHTKDGSLSAPRVAESIWLSNSPALNRPATLP